MVTTIKFVEVVGISDYGRKWFADNKVKKIEGLLYGESKDLYFVITDFIYENGISNRWNDYEFGKTDFALKEL